jgi:hypothetical protein
LSFNVLPPLLLSCRLQGQMLSRYWAQEATYTLNEGLLDMHNRDSLAQLLRGVQLLATVEPEVLEITSTLDRCVCLLGGCQLPA